MVLRLVRYGVAVQRFVGGSGQAGSSNGNPGPGAYTVKSSIRPKGTNRKKIFVSNEQRFGPNTMAKKVGSQGQVESNQICVKIQGQVESNRISVKSQSQVKSNQICVKS